MDAQMKRGFLEVCVLASIKRQDSYGYQIVKDVPAVLNLTESTLYPLLKRLESAGLLVVYSVEHLSLIHSSGRTISWDSARPGCSPRRGSGSANRPRACRRSQRPPFTR